MLPCHAERQYGNQQLVQLEQQHIAHEQKLETSSKHPAIDIHHERAGTRLSNACYTSMVMLLMTMNVINLYVYYMQLTLFLAFDKEKKRKPTPVGARTGASVPRGSPGLLTKSNQHNIDGETYQSLWPTATLPSESALACRPWHAVHCQGTPEPPRHSQGTPPDPSHPAAESPHHHPVCYPSPCPGRYPCRRPWPTPCDPCPAHSGGLWHLSPELWGVFRSFFHLSCCCRCACGDSLCPWTYPGGSCGPCLAISRSVSYSRAVESNIPRCKIDTVLSAVHPHLTAPQ